MNKLGCLIILLVTSSACKGQIFLNASVETWGQPNACEVNTIPDDWIDYSNGSGAGPDEANMFLCPTSIPPGASNGNTYARLWAGAGLTGEGMFQNVSGFAVNNQYQVSFDYAGSNLYGGTSDLELHIFIDDVDIDQTSVFNSADTAWNTHIFSFTATIQRTK